MKSDRSDTAAVGKAGAGKAAKPKDEPVATKQSAELRTVSGAPSRGPMSLEATIGVKIRDLRRKLDVTATDLAQSAGLSAGMLSKIEHGQISPSLTTLQSLAAALHVPITELFSGFEESRDCSYVRHGTGIRIERRGTKVGHQYDLLGHSLAGPIAVEPYLITLTKDAIPYTAFQHEGIEIIYMLSGSVRYRHVDRSYLLEPGDTLFFDSSGSHGPEELLTSGVQYLSIIIYPRN